MTNNLRETENIMKEKGHKKATRQKKGGVKKVTGKATNGNSTNGKLSVPEPPPAKRELPARALRLVRSALLALSPREG